MFAEYYILFYQGKYDVDITVTKSRSECGENELEKSNASVVRICIIRKCLSYIFSQTCILVVGLRHSSSERN